MLLILDIDGVLCNKVDPQHADMADLQFKCYNIRFKSGYRRFLSRCYDRFDVAFYSSTTERNVRRILKSMLTSHQWKKTKFIWCRDRTERDPDIDTGDIRYNSSWDGEQFHNSLDEHA